MDKTKIWEAMYALPGAVVIRRRKSFLMPVLLVAAGIALLILNRSFRADLSNDLRSAIVFVGASLLLAGVAVLFARLFSAGNPYYPAGRCYLRYEELFFEIYEKTAVARCVEEGGFRELLGKPQARVPAVTVSMYRSPDDRFVAMQAFEYADLEYKPLTQVRIVDGTSV